MSVQTKDYSDYTNMSINQLSDSLGFSDPTRFSRFFRRLGGQTLNALRLGVGAPAGRSLDVPPPGQLAVVARQLLHLTITVETPLTQLATDSALLVTSPRRFGERRL